MQKDIAEGLGMGLRSLTMSPCESSVELYEFDSNPVQNSRRKRLFDGFGLTLCHSIGCVRLVRASGDILMQIQTAKCVSLPALTHHITKNVKQTKQRRWRV